MRRLGFTMLELIFVIVIMGILAKFGVEFLAQAYNSFIFSSINNKLQAQSSLALKSVGAKLQYRIKDSVIVRDSTTFNNFVSIGSAPGGNVHNIIEWVGSDIEGYRGDSRPNWSGIIDIDASTANILNSPDTNTTAITNLINVLSYGDSTIADAALYFIGSDNDVLNGYGWDGIAIADHNGSVMHPIDAAGGGVDEFVSSIGGENFSGVDISEYYQLAWTAYAVGITDYNIGANAGTNTGTLTLFYDYQPWNGDTYLAQSDGNATKSEILMENVSTFQFKSIGSVIKIQVCVNSKVMGDYSLCKEKTIF